VRLGCLYLDGRGVAKDAERALTLVRRAAWYEDGEASRLVGDMYATGTGTRIPPNKEGALNFYLDAARLGDAEGQFRAGMAFYAGAGTRPRAGRTVGAALIEVFSGKRPCGLASRKWIPSCHTCTKME
jgi:TPR repeat protein